MGQKPRYSATIVRRKDGMIDICITRDDPSTPDDGDLIEILYGDDEAELKDRAVKFAQERT